MYLVGKPHPNRDLLASFLRENPHETYVTSAEVYQEIIHRYVAIARTEVIADAFEMLDALVDAIYSVSEEDVREAHRICLARARLSGRDCLHVAVMRNHAVPRVLSCDQGFEFVSEIERLPR